jgi:endonuclease/exonuclease/phosphatase family metal-dependent hydrolase
MVELLADVIYSLDVDLLALEEVGSVAAFDEVVQRLPNHDGVLSDHEYGDGTYQKIGFVYDSRRLTLVEATEIFEGSFAFPRPPLEATFSYDDGVNPVLTFTAIAVHLKAGGTAEDRERRASAIAALEGYVRGKVDGSSEDAIVVLGDFNQEIEDANDETVWAPLLDVRYSLRTRTLANQGAASFIPSGSLIDHIATTAEFDAAATTLGTLIPPLDEQMGNFRGLLSDHLPVFTKIQPL